MNLTLIGIPAILLYLLTGTLLGLRLARARRELPAKTGLLVLGLGAVLLHGLVLYQGLLTPLGMNFGFFNAFSLIAWVIALLLLLSAMVKPVENLGIVLLPLAALALFLEIMLPADHLLDKGFSGIDVLVLTSIAAYSLLTIAAVQAILIAIQDMQLHDKHPGGFIRALPPLHTGETLLFQIIAIGFALLSLSLITGAFFLENIFAQHLVHKTVLSIAAWVVFAILLGGRWRFGWRGRTAIRWTLSGFFVLMLAYFGSKWVMEVVLV